MGQLTAEQPKCLIKLAGRSLIDWQLAALKSVGLTRVTVVRGYLKELLSSPDYAVIDNPDWTATNMVASLRSAGELLREESCIVCYSDIVYHPKHLRLLASADGDVAICHDFLWKSLWSARFENPLTDAETFRQENGWLQTIGERAREISDIQGQFMGLLKFTPIGWEKTEAFLATLPSDEQKQVDMTSLLRGLARTGVRIRCIPVAGAWCEVDSESDVRLYERLVNTGNVHWDHDWRWPLQEIMIGQNSSNQPGNPIKIRKQKPYS